MKRIICSTALLALCGAAAAQTTPIYVTNGDASDLRIAQGGNLLFNKNTHGGAYPIAVNTSVWIGQYFGTNAQEYDLIGDPTGNSGTATNLDAIDGTTDGNGTNYVLDNAFSSNGAVYSTNADFSGATFLFNTPNMVRSVGITYDFMDKTLWVSGNAEIRNYTLGGTLISSFGHSSGEGCLAYETLTDSLWFVRNGSNQIDNYSKGGTLLGSVSIAGLAANNWGAEMPILIPGPGAAALLGVSGLLAARRRRS